MGKHLTPAEIATAIKLCQEGHNCPSIGRLLGGRSQATIYQALVRHGANPLGNGDARRRYKLDESVFTKVTEESAYWAGFLMADGSIIARGNACVLSLSLNAIDREHVGLFRTFLRSTHPIRERMSRRRDGYTNKLVTRLEIASRRLADALAVYGVIPHKTFNANAGSCVERDRHFWRGVSDGDGSLYCSSDVMVKPSGRRYPRIRKTFSIVGSKPLMGQFADFVNSALPVDASLRPKRSIFEVRFTGWRAVEVVRLLYSDNTISLSRKQAKADQWMNGPEPSSRSPR